jgi:hypothetical protein
MACLRQSLVSDKNNCDSYYSICPSNRMFRQGNDEEDHMAINLRGIEQRATSAINNVTNVATGVVENTIRQACYHK